MKWETVSVPVTCGCGCGQEIPTGHPVAVFSSGSKRTVDCAARMGFPFDGDLAPAPFDQVEQPSLVAPMQRLANVVTQGELDDRRARRATALERWKARKAARRQGTHA